MKDSGFEELAKELVVNFNLKIMANQIALDETNIEKRGTAAP